MSDGAEIVRAGGEASMWAQLLLAEGKKHWLAGDKWFLARQAEMQAMRAQECRCPENTCGGCTVTLAVANTLEAQAAKLQGAGGDEEFAERGKARGAWKALRLLEAKRAGEIARKFEERNRGRTTPQHWTDKD